MSTVAGHDVIEIDHEVIEILSSSPPAKGHVSDNFTVSRAHFQSPLRSPPHSPPRERERDSGDVLTSSPLFDFEKRVRPAPIEPTANPYGPHTDPTKSTAGKRRAESPSSSPESSPVRKRHRAAPRASIVTPDTSTESLRSENVHTHISEAENTSIVGSRNPETSVSSAAAPSPTLPSTVPAFMPAAMSAVMPASASKSASQCASKPASATTKSASKSATKSTSTTLSDTPSTARPAAPAASRTSTLDDSKRGSKPVFADAAPGSTESKRPSRVAAATKVSDRKSACEKLVCELWVDKSGWQEKLAAELTNLDVSVRCESRSEADARCPDGVSLVVTAYGNFDDEWDEELGVFVKCASHREQMCTTVAVLDASFMDTLGHMDLGQRSAYFAKVTRFAIEACCADPKTAVLYMIPEVGAHFKKQAARFNREMRKIIASASPSGAAEPPPDEHFYTNLETELQVMHGIRAYYPRKAQDAAEMIANCVVDMGYSRYHALLDETHDAAGAYVRSKSTTLDVTIESLTKIQGLPPRIAARLGSEAQSLGRIRSLLGSNSSMRQSRLKLFGKGNWNDALLTFLEDEDPKRVI